jgi:hypothetical protein
MMTALELLLTNMAAFNCMMDNPSQYEDADPDVTVTLEDIVQLHWHESFYLLEPLEERWGWWDGTGWVMFKCTCPDFFGCGCCAHSTLMALMYD